MLQRHAAELELSDEQLDRLEALKVGHELEKVDLQAALHKAKIQLRAKMRDLETSERDAFAAIDEVGRCEGELRKMRYRHLRAAQAILSEGQREKVRRFHQQHVRERLEAIRSERRSA
jgi:hypothetical protein